MKFSAAIILAALPLLAAAVPAAQHKQGKTAVASKAGKSSASKGAAANAAAVKAAAAKAAAVKAQTAAAAKGKGAAAAVAAKGKTGAKIGTGAAGGAVLADAAAAGGAAAAANATAAATPTGDLQSSLTLDPSVIQTNFAQDGQGTPTPGQVASLTSTNNFINFCATVPNLPLTNGQQIKTGSCNGAPMGIIAANTNIPSCKFVFPPNGDASLQPFQQFTVKLAIQHLTAGNFVNAQQSYFAGPQTVDAKGDIIGHSHVVIEAIAAINSTAVSDPTKFAFFKGIDTGADANGQLTVNVAAGLPAGAYKISTINSASNHQPVLVAVAQHGSTDDAVYFTVGAGGADVAGEDAAAEGGASAIAAAASAAAAATAAPAAAAAAAATPAAAAAAAATPAAAAAAGSAALAAKGQKGAAAATKGAAPAKAPAATKGAAAAKGGKFSGFKGAKQGGKRFIREY